MEQFLSTVLASSIGFIIAKFATAWFDANVSKASYLEGERNSDVERASKLIDQISELGCAYWASEKGQKSLPDQYRIPADISDLGGILHELFEGSNESLVAVRTELDRFDDAITSRDFGSTETPQRLEYITDIRKCAGALKKQLRAQRRKLSPKWFGMK